MLIFLFSIKKLVRIFVSTYNRHYLKEDYYLFNELIKLHKSILTAITEMIS